MVILKIVLDHVVEVLQKIYVVFVMAIVHPAQIVLEFQMVNQH
jgi:hypothetical protein